MPLCLNKVIIGNGILDFSLNVITAFFAYHMRLVKILRYEYNGIFYFFKTFWLISKKLIFWRFLDKIFAFLKCSY